MRDDQGLDAALEALARVDVRPNVVDAGVRDALAEARRRELGQPPPGHRRWWIGLGVPAAFAAGFAVALFVVDAPPAPVVEAPAVAPPEEERNGSVVEIESGLWIHASGGAVVQTRRSDGAVDFRLARGTLGVRLFKGPGRPRRTVSVWSGDVQVRATGTIFSVTQTGDGTIAHVTEGTVEVEHRDGVLEVSAGEMYEAGAVRPTEAAPAAHDALAGVSAPPPSQTGVPAPPASDAAPEPHRSRADVRPAPAASPRRAPPGSKLRRGEAAPARTPEPAGRTTDAAPAAETPSASELWRTARRLLAQQRQAEALEPLQRAAASEDPVWAPIATLELARVHLRDGRTERAAEVAEHFLDRFAAHALAPEARAVLCRADSTRDACEGRGGTD
jgi:hypothetical protein